MNKAQPTPSQWRAAGKMGAVKGKAGPSQRWNRAFLPHLGRLVWQADIALPAIHAMARSMEPGPRKLIAAVLVPGLALAGCAGTSDRYPSLSVRDFERASATGTEEPSLTPRPASEELLARIEFLLAEAEEAHLAFTAASPEADRIIAAAAGMNAEDNGWATAQIALANLVSKRGTTAIALGDIDQLYSDATLDFISRDGIAQARDKVAMLIAMEDQTLERLRSQLDR